MQHSLAVDDPLAEKDVTIIITLATDAQSREERPVLVSVGVAEQLPVIKTGVFGDVSALIQEAWTAFGVRAQLNEAVADNEDKAVGNGNESVADEVAAAEEQVLAVADTEPAEVASIPLPKLSPPQPQATNLSLF